MIAFVTAVAFSEFEFIVALRLAGQPEEFAEGADRQVRAHLLGSGMDELVNLEFEVSSVEPLEGHPAGWELEATLPLIVKLEVRGEGAHTLDFYVNGKLQAGRSVALWVQLQS